MPINISVMRLRKVGTVVRKKNPIVFIITENQQAEDKYLVSSMSWKAKFTI